jgi:hypothetical protein
MITKCKVYGERHSGTNYIAQLIDKNFVLDDLGFFHTKVGGWKHSPEKIGEIDTLTTLVLIIFRDAAKWLVALHRDPWNVDPRASLDEFAQLPLAPGTHGAVENEYIDHTYNYGMTPLEMRRLKVVKWRELLGTNTVFIHLDTLQLTGALPLLAELESVYGLKRKMMNLEDIITHVNHLEVKERAREPRVILSNTVLDLIRVNEATDEEIFITEIKDRCYRMEKIQNTD